MLQKAYGTSKKFRFQFRGQLNKPFSEPTYLYTNLNFENDKEDVDLYDHKSFKVSKRLQPKRNCKIDEKVDMDNSTDSETDLDSSDSNETLDQEQCGYKIRKYYEKHGTNPLWQKDRGGEFACQHCNLDCKTSEGLQSHDKFYHQPWPNSAENLLKESHLAFSKSSIEKNLLKQNSQGYSDQSKIEIDEAENESGTTDLEELIDRDANIDHDREGCLENNHGNQPKGKYDILI